MCALFQHVSNICDKTLIDNEVFEKSGLTPLFTENILFDLYNNSGMFLMSLWVIVKSFKFGCVDDKRWGKIHFTYPTVYEALLSTTPPIFCLPIGIKKNIFSPSITS